jgi:hypothetical protein
MGYAANIEYSTPKKKGLMKINHANPDGGSPSNFTTAWIKPYHTKKDS